MPLDVPGGAEPEKNGRETLGVLKMSRESRP